MTAASLSEQGTKPLLRKEFIISSIFKDVSFVLATFINFV